MKDDFERIERAIRFIEAHAAEQPDLERVAAHVGLSPFHFQRLFRRWAGTSPKRFLEYLTVAHAKALLRSSHSVLDAAFEVGLSSPGRLHDHFVSIEAVSPGEFSRDGAGMRIAYGIHPSPFGEMLLAATGRGVCALAFVDRGRRDEELENLRRDWPRARLVRDQAGTAVLAARIFDAGKHEGDRIHLAIRGTNFQVNVWRALLRIPAGAAVSYQTLAGHLGTGSRAVAGAVASNPVAFLIPCHRVIRSSGDLSGYRWGPGRKRAMLAWESAQYGNADSTRQQSGLGVA